MADVIALHALRFCMVLATLVATQPNEPYLRSLSSLFRPGLDPLPGLDPQHDSIVRFRPLVPVPWLASRLQGMRFACACIATSVKNIASTRTAEELACQTIRRPTTAASLIKTSSTYAPHI